MIATDGGVGYEVTVPLGVLERLPANGARVSLHTELVVKEDGWSLFGFDRAAEREVFQRLLGASGFGPQAGARAALGAGARPHGAEHTRRDLAALSTVSGIGKKKAERLVLELQDRFEDIVVSSTPAIPLGPAEEAVKALIALGYAPAQPRGGAGRAAGPAGRCRRAHPPGAARAHTHRKQCSCCRAHETRTQGPAS